MIELAIQTSDPEFGKTLLDSLVANYNERGMEELRNRDMKTVELIERRLLTLGEDLANAELGIESFQKDQNLIDIPTQAEQALVKSYELQTLIETAKTELDLLKNTLNFFKNEDNKYNLIPMESSETGGIFNEMIAAYNEQVVERMNLSLGARPNNEALKIQNKKIDAIRENLLSTFGKAYENTKIRYDEQVALKRQLDAQLAQVPNKQRVFRAIGRDQAVKEQLYLFLLQQHEEKSISVENAQPRAMIVDEAYTYPESHKFSLKNLLLLVIFIGFVVPAGIVFVTELLRNKLSRSTKMSSLTSVPLLGDVEVEKNSQLIAMREGGSDAMIEDFRKLRANLDYILPDKSEKVVLVTGLSTTDRAAVVAVNLAAACAMTGKKVVVVDADVRDGKLLESLDIALEYGLTDYLGGDQSTIDKIVTRETSAAAPFDIIGAGRSTILGVELLTSDRMADLLDKLRESYDKVIIMAAPMSRYADAYALGDFVDASIVVVTSEKTPFGAFETINECAADERLPKLSIVRLTNQISKKKK